MRNIAIFVMLLTLGYAIAPTWIAQGAKLDYSAGSDTVSFTVIKANSTDLKIEIKSSSSSKVRTGTENASASTGQFWFDSSLLSGASVGSTIEDYSVTQEGKQTFAGKEWDTITLQGLVSNATTTKIYDKKSGLLLKQTVDAQNVPTVILTNFNIPSLTTYSAPPPTTPPATPENDTTGTAQQNTTGAAQQNTTAQPTQPAEQPPIEPGTEPSGEESGGVCASAAVLLALSGFSFWRRD